MINFWEVRKALIQPFTKNFIAILAASLLLLTVSSSVTPMRVGNDQKAIGPSGAEKKAAALTMKVVASAWFINSPQDIKNVSDRLSEVMHFWIELREPDEAARA